MLIDNSVLNGLLEEARVNPRLRMNRDLRNGPEDGSQRMLNALAPDTVLPIHRHRASSETVILLKGHLTEVFYDDDGNETERFDLNPLEGRYGISVPVGQWHSLICHEPSVLFEAKDGKWAPLIPEDTLIHH